MTTITHPPTLINAYLAEKIDEMFGGSKTVPFFPSMPTDIDALSDLFPDADFKFAVYDRMFMMRKTPFPHVKCEQLFYYFYNYGQRGPAPIIEISQLVQDLLDNGDESAQELNYWVRHKLIDGLFPVGQGFVKPVFFHSMKIYQLEETKNVINFGSTRPYSGNKMIINYDYHKTDSETRPF